MLKKQVLGQITRIGKPTAQEKKRLKKRTKAELEAILAGLKAQAKKKAKAKPKRSRRSSRSKIGKADKARAGKLVTAIKNDRIPVKQQKRKPSDYASGTAKEKYAKFVALYKGVRLPKRGAKAAKTTLLQRYQDISGTKYPYYLSRGYHVKAFNVGGGKSGPGLVRAIPGMKSAPFSTLSKSQQGKIVNFLNGAGKALRSKGAKASVTYSQLAQVAKKKASRKSKKSQKRGAANWRNW